MLLLPPLGVEQGSRCCQKGSACLVLPCSREVIWTCLWLPCWVDLCLGAVPCPSVCRSLGWGTLVLLRPADTDKGICGDSYHGWHGECSPWQHQARLGRSRSYMTLESWAVHEG